MTIIAMALRGRHTEDASSVTRRQSFFQWISPRARGVPSSSSSTHPPRRATRPIRVATSTTRLRLYIFYIASHRSIGPSDRSDAVARVTHHSSILFIHRGRGVRYPHNHLTYVLPKSRAPSSPPLELRRTMETPRLAVVLTETTEVVVFAETDIFWASMVNKTTCVRVRRTTGDARVVCVCLSTCVRGHYGV